MDSKCPVYSTLDFIGKRWTLLIMAELYRDGGGWKRYSRVKAGLAGITPKILSMRLKELEKDGYIGKRIDATGFPIKSEYSLTEKGTGFIAIVESIRKWAIRNRVGAQHCSRKDCSVCNL